MASNVSVTRFEQVSIDEALKKAAAELKAEGISVENMELDKGDATKKPKKEKKEEEGTEEDNKDGLPDVTKKNAVMMLNEKRKGLKYELIAESGEGSNKFWTMSVEVDGDAFEGTGRSKRHAKNECAKHALVKLFNMLVVPDELTAEEQASQVAQYIVKITTGDLPEHGTTAQGWIKMMSPRRRHTGRQQLVQDAGQSFQSGSTKTFTIEAFGLEQIRKIELGHDGTEEDHGWYVKKVEIDIPSKEKHFEFTTDSWIAHDKGDGVKTAKIFIIDGYVPGPATLPKKNAEGGEDGEDGMNGKKRGLDGEDGGLAKKLKSGLTKNALMHLYELKPGLQFHLISQTGPIHSPIFTMSVDVNGQTFVGSGNSKKTAKAATAEAALKSFVQFPNASDAHAALGRDAVMNVDFTSDNPEVFLQHFDGKEPMDIQVPQLQSPNGTSVAMLNGKPIKNTEGKHPVVILNELKPDLKYNMVSETGDNHTKTFTMSVEVDGETFEGSARNKKMAKARCAQAALTKIFNLSFLWGWGPGAQPVNNTEKGGENLPSALADHVSKVVLGKFAALTDGMKSQYARRKVMSGIVMTKEEDISTAKVICVTTGTKCINGENLSNEGKSVNDFHAEILARRAMQRFLYSQLELIASGDEEKVASSIFEKCEDSDLYEIKEGYKFHLYISTAPNGDSRIFSPHEHKTFGPPQPDSEQKNPPNKKGAGQLRTNVGSGEGTIPVKSETGIQTWDGVMQGERLLTMSCSDKIARWNLLGMQGALLNHFIKPVYLDTLILGSLYHSDHLARAVYGRFSTVEDIIEPFIIHKPNLSGISNPEERQLGKAPNFAVDWSCGDKKHEVISILTGKLETGDESILCKKNMFKRFLKLAETLPIGYKKYDGLSYSEVKALNTDYQANKDKLVEHFADSGLGHWVKKPQEVDQFTVELEEIKMEQDSS